MVDSRQIKAYVRPLLRWWWLIVVAIVLSGVTAYLIIRARGPVYVTRGLVMVGNMIQERNPDLLQSDMARGLAATYVRLAQYGSLPELTKDALGIDRLPEYEISVVPESQLIQVIVTDTDPTRAQIVAAELINQLMALSPGGSEQLQRRDFAAEQIQKLQEGITQAELSIAALQDELATTLSARQIRLIEERVGAQETKLTTLRANYVGLLQSTDEGSSNTIRLVDPPQVPTLPVASNDLILMAIAVALGTTLAIAGAYALEMLDDRVRDVEDLREEFGLATLGVLPDTIQEETRGPLVMVQDPHTLAAESFRVLRTNLLFASVDQPLKVLLITSPGPGEGKSHVSSNLAVAFAKTGQQVILIDADLRKPTVHRLFGMLNNSGVSTALLGGKQAIQDGLQVTHVPGLRLMASGPLPPNPSELLTSNRMQELIAKMSTMCDLIIDSPPVTVVSDSAMLASRTDGVLLVLPADNLGRERVRHSMSALKAVHANVLGAVLNRAVSEDLGFYYSHKSDYGNQYYMSLYDGEEKVAATTTSEQTPAHMLAEVALPSGPGGKGLFDLQPGSDKFTQIQGDANGAGRGSVRASALVANGSYKNGHGSANGVGYGSEGENNGGNGNSMSSKVLDDPAGDLSTINEGKPNSSSP